MAGPIIRHDELFGFEDFRKGLKDLESGLKEFGSSVDQTIKNINSNLKDMKSFFADTAAVLKATNLSMVGAKDSLQKYNEEIETTRAENEKLKSSGEGMKQMLNAQEASVTELRAEYNKLKKEYEALKPTQADYAQQVQNIDKRITAVLPGIKNYEKALRDQKKYVDVVNDTYGQWQQRLASLKVQLVNTTGAFDPLTGKLNKNNKEAVALSTEIGQLDKVLKTADATMGVYGRNVGNYASGFSPLNNAINQLTREAPSAAVSMQTFFLAISNNIPQLVDATNNIKKMNAEMVAAGEKPVPLWKQLFSAFFSWNTLISVGITLLTLYGSKIVAWVSSLFKGSDALSLASEKIKLFNEVMKEGNKNAGEDITKLKILYEAATDVNLAMKDRLLAVHALQREFPEYFGNLDDEVIKNGKAKNSYDELYESILKTSRAKAATGKLDALAVERLDQETQRQKVLNATAAEAARVKRTTGVNFAGVKTVSDLSIQQKYEYDLNVIEERRAKALGEIDKKLEAITAKEKFLKAFAGEAGLVRAAGGDPVKDAKEAEEAKKKAQKDAEDSFKKFKEYIAKQQELLKSAAELEIKENELKLAKGLITEFEFQGKKLDIIRNYVNKAIELEKKLGGNADPKKIQDFQKEAKDGELGFTKFMQDQYANRSKLAKDSIQEVVDADKKAKKAEEDLEDRLTKKFQDAQKDKLDAYLNFLQRENALEEARHGKNFAREISYLNKIIDAKKRAGEDYSKDQEARDIKLADRQHEIQQGLIQLAKDAVAAGLQIIQEQYDYSYQERIKQLEEQKTYELNLAGTNAVARANIERDFNQKIAKEKEKQAKADKAFALFGVAINTAGAIAKTIEEWGMPFALPFIGLAVAQGLIQAAVIAARPIPKYEKGTASAKAGEAIINEKGWELIERNGRMFVEGGGHPTITRMTGGEKVYPHEASKGIVDQAIKAGSVQ
jgi:ABC-type transporter Mla subunit MlaD